MLLSARRLVVSVGTYSLTAFSRLSRICSRTLPTASQTTTRTYSRRRSKCGGALLGRSTPQQSSPPLPRASGMYRVLLQGPWVSVTLQLLLCVLEKWLAPPSESSLTSVSRTWRVLLNLVPNSGMLAPSLHSSLQKPC